MKNKWIKLLSATCTLVVLAMAYYIYCVPSRELAPFLKRLGQARQLTIWEGLPHQKYEPAQLKSELETKETVQLHGFPFYAKQQEIESGDAARIRQILSWPRNYNVVKPGTMKSCGGYHPDYAIEWGDEDGVHQVHFCFGCWEVKVYGPTSEAHYDLDNAARDQLQNILNSYRDQRPEFESF